MDRGEGASDTLSTYCALGPLLTGRSPLGKHLLCACCVLGTMMRVIHPLSTHLLHTHSAPRTVLATGHTALDEQTHSCLREAKSRADS